MITITFKIMSLNEITKSPLNCASFYASFAKYPHAQAIITSGNANVFVLIMTLDSLYQTTLAALVALDLS